MKWRRPHMLEEPGTEDRMSRVRANVIWKRERYPNSRKRLRSAGSRLGGAQRSCESLK